MYILRPATRPHFFARVYAFLCTRCTCVYSRQADTYTMSREEYAYTHARPVERYVSSDRTTVAREPGQASRNASPFLSPITLFRLFSYPSLFFFHFSSFFYFFFFFCHDVNPTRQKQKGVHRRRSPGSLFSSVVLRSHSVPLFLSPFVRSSDCSVYCASRTIPGKKKSTTKKCSCGRGRVLAPCCRAACRASAFDRSLTLVLSAMFCHFLRLLLGNEPPTRINQSYSTGKKI